MGVLLVSEPNRRHSSNQERTARIPGGEQRARRLPPQALADGEISIPSFSISDALAAELLAVRVGDRNEPVMVLPSLIGIKVLLFGKRGLLSRFFHLDFHLGSYMRHYRKNSEFAQVPISAVT